MYKALICLILTALLPSAPGALPAFPGAEGFGSETHGGRGGAVVFVTNLNNTGAGSFRQALLTPGKRTIIFRTSGVVQGTAEIYPEAANLSYVTIAGQTSPGGITITSSTGSPIFQYTSNRMTDEVWRFVRFRIDRAAGGNGGDHAFEHYQAVNFIIDHCDFSGGDDECLDIGYSRHWTIQWSTIANSGSGGQKYGALIAYTNPTGGYPLGHYTLHHNLIANHSKRGPEQHWLWKTIPDSGQVDFRSNIVYNVDQYGTTFWGCTTQVLIGNVVGNYFKPGPSCSYNYFPPVNAEKGAHLYIKDNFWDSPGKSTAVSYRITDPNDPDTVVCKQYGSQPVLVSAPWNFPAVTTTRALVTRDTVLAKVGAWPRDSMDRRTVNNVRNGTGGLGLCSDPLITTGPAAPADADMDGMPDFWETGMGFNPNDSTGKNTDHDADGYTNLEEYLNDLALARLCQNYYNPVYPIPSDWPDYNTACCKSLAVEWNGKADMKQALSVSPNPCVAGKGLVIRSGAGDLQILDINGRVVKNLKSSSLINFNGTLAPGLYFVRQGGMKCKFIILP